MCKGMPMPLSHAHGRYTVRAPIVLCAFVWCTMGYLYFKAYTVASLALVGFWMLSSCFGFVRVGREYRFFSQFS